MAPYRRRKADDLLGTVVTVAHARTTSYDRVTNVTGTVWAEADPKVFGGGSFWIADGQNYYIVSEYALRPALEDARTA
jgi:hypothetical protein